MPSPSLWETDGEWQLAARWGGSCGRASPQVYPELIQAPGTR